MKIRLKKTVKIGPKHYRIYRHKTLSPRFKLYGMFSSAHSCILIAMPDDTTLVDEMFLVPIHEAVHAIHREYGLLTKNLSILDGSCDIEEHTCKMISNGIGDFLHSQGITGWDFSDIPIVDSILPRPTIEYDCDGFEVGDMLANVFPIKRII